MDGFEATRHIRALDGGLEVKIAAVTASGFLSERDKALEAGLDDFIRKPYRPEEIFDCLAHHLGVRYSRAMAEPEPALEPVAELRPGELAFLPEELRQPLRESIISLDVERISRAIESVIQHDPALGAAMKRSASRYALSGLLEAIDGPTDKLPLSADISAKSKPS